MATIFEMNSTWVDFQWVVGNYIIWDDLGVQIFNIISWIGFEMVNDEERQSQHQSCSMQRNVQL